MRKERLAHGWSLPELSQRTGYDAGHLSRVENGKRPPTEALATAYDVVFSERRGWFTDWYQESRSWSEVPAGFRSWSERAILATFPAVTEETIATRLASRVERQSRVLARDDPPKTIFLVDELALYRQVGTAEVMAGQMRHLAAAAAMSHVTIQVLPAVAHPANASGFVIADDAVWCEHVRDGQRPRIGPGAGHRRPRWRNADAQRRGVAEVHRHAQVAGALEATALLLPSDSGTESGPS